MKENRFIYRETPEVKIGGKEEMEKESTTSLSSEDLAKLSASKDKVVEIRKKADIQAEEDSRAADQLLEDFEQSEIVENRLDKIIDDKILRLQPVGKNAAEYLVKNMSLVGEDEQQNLVEVLGRENCMTAQPAEVLFNLLNSLTKVSVATREEIIKSKITQEINALKPAGRAVNPDLLVALSIPNVQNIVTPEQWNAVWAKTKEEDKKLWKALVLPNVEVVLAKK
ncbi:hypothetical protein GF354_02255 [Candidatus Peregrinibacteria bacterium]|nr:hypothetical protein [Candidatus Peregrinibacteria bacterium]